MQLTFRSRLTGNPEEHRASPYGIFFDIVFIFALVRITMFMSWQPSATTLAQGLIILPLLWISWVVYSWRGNHARIDTGLVRTGTRPGLVAHAGAGLHRVAGRRSGSLRRRRRPAPRSPSSCPVSPRSGCSRPSSSDSAASRR